MEQTETTESRELRDRVVLLVPLEALAQTPNIVHVLVEEAPEQLQKRLMLVVLCLTFQQALQLTRASLIRRNLCWARHRLSFRMVR